jgi:flagellar hook-length control protein FliK
MNIEGVNLSSVLPANSAIEGGTQSLPENGAIPEGFSNALMGQIELLSEANGPAGMPGQLQSVTMSQTMNNLHDIADLLKHNGGEKELAAFLDKYLPSSYKKIGSVGLNENADLEATLLALTDALKSIAPSTTSDEVSTAQNMSNVMALNGLAFVKPLPEEAKLKMPAKESVTSDEVPAAQNMSNVMALNGLSFVKPLPEEAKLNIPGKENVAAEDFLQNKAVQHQLIQDKQGVNLQYVENAGPVEKTLVIEKQAALSGIEQAAPGVSANMVQLHNPVDNRTETPAITRPLTHPDWSKDLGEQIVWMNNKTISAAEINLNPAHLGPISVRIDVNQDQAIIMFTAQHAEVKEAIEASIPKLREMLATQQLDLINVNISQNSKHDQGRSQSQTFSKMPGYHEQSIDGVTDTIEHERVVVSKGLLSIYA